MPGLTSRTVLDDKQLAWLGSVVAESTYTEMLVDAMLREISGMDKAEMALFMRGAMMQTKLDTLRDLGQMKLKSKKRKAKFAALIRDIAECNGERVIAVHGVWTAPPVPEHVRSVGLAELLTLANKSLAEATHPRGGKMRAQNLERLANKISAAYWNLFQFYMEVWIRPAIRRRFGPSRSKPHAQPDTQS